MSFEDDFRDQAWPVLLAQHGETVVYRPAGGEPRTFTALVTRSPPDLIDGAQRGVFAGMLVEVKNDSVSGITMSELDTGRDRIDVATRPGGNLVMRPISHFRTSRRATLVLEVR